MLKPFSTAGVILNNTRLIHEQVEYPFEQNYDSLLDSKMVLNVPFKGLLYPYVESIGSAFYPKILGSYERELQKTLTKFIDEDYSEIIDIGCAEGYYAIGLAIKFTKAKIYAFDINKRAQELCSKMAILNCVSDRVEFGSEVTPNYLSSFKFAKKGLIICDCEGFESELFNEHNIDNLKSCDLIIQTHDFLSIEISGNLKKLFSKTHDIESIFSIDDIHKAQNYYYPEISNMSLVDKKKILSERRPSIMEWIICKPKT